MKIPFLSRSAEPTALETRSGAYEDALIQAIVSAAAGGAEPSGRTATAEIAASMFAKAFASAAVSPENTATAALSPSVLAAIGRALVNPGEAVFVLDVVGGQARALQAATWDIQGGPDPRSWTYDVELPGPSVSVQRSVSAEQVIHVRYAAAPGQPWKGVGPLVLAGDTMAAAANMDGRLRQEASARSGYVLPVPKVDDKLQSDLDALKGKTVLVESTAGGWAAGSSGAPRSDWAVQRLGMNPPPALAPLRSAVNASVLAACGIAPSLFEGEGAASREAHRQFGVAIQAVGRVVTAELRAKVDDALALDFAALATSDLSGRARALGTLVTAGVPLAVAAAIAGLVDHDA